jgi:hypothetical protein
MIVHIVSTVMTNEFTASYAYNVMAEGSSFIQEMISGLLLSEISNKVEK